MDNGNFRPFLVFSYKWGLKNSAPQKSLKCNKGFFISFSHCSSVKKYQNSLFMMFCKI